MRGANGMQGSRVKQMANGVEKSMRQASRSLRCSRCLDWTCARLSPATRSAAGRSLLAGCLPPPGAAGGARPPCLGRAPEKQPPLEPCAAALLLPPHSPLLLLLPLPPVGTQQTPPPWDGLVAGQRARRWVLGQLGRGCEGQRRKQGRGRAQGYWRLLRCCHWPGCCC